MPKARVRLFARLADLAGTREAEIEIGEGLTVADVFPLLTERFPMLAGFDAAVRYAVNAQYVPETQAVREGDEVALIPPVSGGSRAV